ncbi:MULTISPECIES: chromosome segregation protein SMC [unclassified Arthrobacter]|uniref:chromosome segregation protein SMC n=1 Tax=unclassified Arthrobacter TaxID=235627 RepID=UPI0024DFF368|nr:MULTISPECIES: chromosome segregation protein SMC [unclassified Arthrobacter]MCC9145736.1 chromosome segregation protein SMC [Arthrobacter sp. zg-Y919]MDK1276965.1 chromosome segregation protein SMC [Arthrobacter sp. zg.Y919]WIB04104.1 chromosome segregation protein SMC [Arthrobacter sp. zg-Y919]
MHLKTLTMRGFKSFASATTFEFEPGVTAVVGPNGSGKSNVVDALAWVMGEQGAKTLRGGKMEDVIFAGTSGRSPLGRAQVSLTIDNADGALPIEYSEVTISRTLFRAGGSEYAINGTPCRLLDIQELLSDSGLGREMHVIVGQGQLDKVLHASAEERRGFIEEAAGILKHRRRKEKTLRKLDAMQANLARVTDLTAELRRQLGPLGKQAAVARRAKTVQQDVRDARSRLLADDLATLTAAFEKEAADESALKARRLEVEAAVNSGRQRQAELEAQAAQAAPQLNAARDTWYELSSLQERFRSLSALAAERARLLGAVEPDAGSGRDPEQLQASADRVRAEAAALETEIEDRRARLDDAVEIREAAEEEAADEEKRYAGLLRAAADRREGLARLAGQMEAARSRVASAQSELGRLQKSITAAEARRAGAQEEFGQLEGSAAGAEAGEADLDAEYEEAQAALEEAQEALQQLRLTEGEAVREAENLAARREALAVGLDRRDGSAALRAAGLSGVLEPLADLISVKPGSERTVAAALGTAADALAADDIDAAARALRHLKDTGEGQAELVVGGTPTPAVELPAHLPPGAVPVLSLISADAKVQDALNALLGNAVAVQDLDAAVGLVSLHPGATAVTADGDVLTAFGARGGSASAPGLLEISAAVEETDARLSAARTRAEEARAGIGEATARADVCRARTDAALAALHESDARLAAVAERLGTLGSALRAASGEADRLAALVSVAEANVVDEEAKLAAVSERLATAGEEPQSEEEPSADRRDALALAAASARQAEMDARLGLRSTEEQLKAVSGRAESLERAAAAERRARIAAAERSRLRSLQRARAVAVGAAADAVLAHLQVSLGLASGERDRAEETRTAREAELAAVRSSNNDAAAELARLTDSVHRDELARAQQRLRIEALETRALEELGMTAEHLVANFGPDQPVPVPAEPDAGDKWAALHAPVDEDGNPLLDGIPYVRAEQEKRLKRAERDLAALGKVNPLALEEFAALEERHQFLSTQLEDLKATRKDLLDIIADVDRRVEEVFTAAYRDTAKQFEHVFGRLFPGGEGRLILTDPDNMLTTGIEVHARPAGKKIKRLSLLSGGERSLTAVALLVAIFKARPSPFYVMDEVEAALDDTNLGRLITIFEELRESSQLIVITHQKRTMEVADALYGVTMRGDGVSTVISQRIERTPAEQE